MAGTKLLEPCQVKMVDVVIYFISEGAKLLVTFLMAKHRSRVVRPHSRSQVCSAPMFYLLGALYKIRDI